VSIVCHAGLTPGLWARVICVAPVSRRHAPLPPPCPLLFRCPGFLPRVHAQWLATRKARRVRVIRWAEPSSRFPLAAATVCRHGALNRPPAPFPLSPLLLAVEMRMLRPLAAKQCAHRDWTSMRSVNSVFRALFALLSSCFALLSSHFQVKPTHSLHTYFSSTASVTRSLTLQLGFKFKLKLRLQVEVLARILCQ
jgi:hypothetical protein